MLTYIWRWGDVGVALVLFAAVHEELGKRSKALLQIVNGRETAPLLVSLHPGVETDVAPAGSVSASAFVILACTKQLSIVFDV